MSKILITGGTGLVGKHLTDMLLELGHEVVILTRKPQARMPGHGLSFARWDVDKKEIDLRAIQGVDHIIHLAGAGVIDKKWTASYKKEIIDSRAKSSELIFDTLKNNPHQVKTFLSASATGWYGADPAPNGKAFVETDPPNKKFLGEICHQWEASAEQFEKIGIRVVKFRFGIVLSKKGGAFAEFKKPLPFGIAAMMGNGRQMISWIHIEDLCNLIIYGMENESISGSYNAVAPSPVSNKELVLTMAKKFNPKFHIPMHVPEFMLKLMLGERSCEILDSRTVSSEKILSTGFQFQYPIIETAMDKLASKN